MAQVKNFHRLGVYRNRYFLDIDMVVLEVLNNTDEKTDMRVIYLTQSTARMLAKDDVSVKRSDHKNWTRIE